jgi:hypothetical protein
MTILIAAKPIIEKPEHGWGNLLGLVVALLIGWAAIEAHKRWMATKEDPSPTPGATPLEGVKPQLTAGPDTKLTPSPTAPQLPAAPPQGPALESYVAQHEAAGTRTTDIVTTATRQFPVSRSTVMRALKKVRGGGS